MLLAHHGAPRSLEEIRTLLGAGRDGASAFGMLEVARGFGLRGRAVRMEAEDLERLEAGSILHWKFDHFVVFERCRRDRVDIIDPALGRRQVNMEEFRRSFTGVALLLEPASTSARWGSLR